MMKLTVAAGLTLVGLVCLGVSGPAFAGTHTTLKGTLTLTPGTLHYTANAAGLDVIDATGSGAGWHVAITGDAHITSYSCGAGSTCTLPSPGITGNNDIIAAPDTGMGVTDFNWNIAGTVTVDLSAGP